MSRIIPWILLLLALVALGWMIYFQPHPNDMTHRKEREAFQDTIHRLRDSVRISIQDAVLKSNRTDSTLSSTIKVAKEALKDRDHWRASYKATKARLDTLSDKDYRPVADSLLAVGEQKVDSLYKTIEELKVSTEALTEQLKFERGARDKVLTHMQAQVDKFEERNTKLEAENEELRKQNRNGKIIGGVAVGLAFLAGLLVN